MPSIYHELPTPARPTTTRPERQRRRIAEYFAHLKKTFGDDCWLAPDVNRYICAAAWVDPSGVVFIGEGGSHHPADNDWMIIFHTGEHAFVNHRGCVQFKCDASELPDPASTPDMFDVAAARRECEAEGVKVVDTVWYDPEGE